MTDTRQVRSTDENIRLSIGFAQFFVDKISRIKSAIELRLSNSRDDPLQFDLRHTAEMFNDVQPPTVDEVLRVIRLMLAKSASKDSVPTSVIKTCAETFSVLITRLITLSFDQGKFPDRYTHALITPLLKKDGLDADSFNDYRPILNLHTISKIMERVFMSRLVSHVKHSPNYNRLQ